MLLGWLVVINEIMIIVVFGTLEVDMWLGFQGGMVDLLYLHVNEFKAHIVGVLEGEHRLIILWFINRHILDGMSLIQVIVVFLCI